jgi:Ni,Fe-hydrogenase III component G
MKAEEAVRADLERAFPFLKDKVFVRRERRIFAEVPYGSFRAVLECAVKKLDFSVLCTISGLDEGAALSLIYHLARPAGMTLNLKTSVPKDNPIVKTVIDIFPNAEIYEREVVDLLGAKVDGLPDGKRYPLPDDWPKGEYPLRKDWRAKKDA